MIAALYILGTSHTLQCGSAECTQASIFAFDTELRKLCEKLKIRCIADEMTPDGLKLYKVRKTIGERVARDLRIAHHHVDLSLKKRSALSLGETSVAITAMSCGFGDDGSGFREAFGDLADGIRERYWIAKILEIKQWPTLFVCGADHAVSVRRLWRRLGLEAKVVHLDYEP